MKYSSYQKCKPSGVEWLGDVPEHWEVKRGRFCMRVNPPSERLRMLKPEDEVSFIPMESVGEYGGLNLDVTKPLGEIGTSYTEFQDGDVVVAKITPCFENGKGALASGLTNDAALGTTELHVLRALSVLDRRFLFYLTISSVYRKTGEAEMYGAGGQKRVPPEFNKDFRTPLPPIPEQRAIADFLDAETEKLDSLIAKKQALIEKLKEKRTALISQTVTRGLPPEAARAAGLNPHPKLKPSGIEWLGDLPEHWEVKKGRFLGTLLGSVAPSEDDVVEDEDGTPYAKVDDLNHVDSSLLLVETKTRVRGIPGRQRKIILFPKRGAAIFTNKVVIADGLFLFDSNLMGWQIDSSHDTKFVAYCLVARRLDDLADVSTVPQINNKHIYPAEFPCPSLGEQQAIAEYLDLETAKIDRMVAKAEEAIERLQEYRTALITAAVTGKIDVRAKH